MDLSRLSDGDIQDAIRKMQKGIEIKPGGVEAAELQTSIDRALEELQRRTQKKSQSQPIEKIEQLPTKTEMQEWAKKEQDETNYAHVETIEEQPTYTTTTTSTANLKTIKAPTVDREPEYINIELTDQKGAKYIRTYNRAQVKSLCRKYFSNIHNAWVGGNRKLTNGFDNLLAYFLGWAEFDGKKPTLQDVLQDYFRYKKASEKSEDSESFKVAKELYDKIISAIE